MTRLFLIRHGEPAEEARYRCYGSLDVGLSEAGRAQMAPAAEYLKAEPIAAIYSSPRSRAIESARILAAGTSRPIVIVNHLCEIHFGDFEGLSYDEIAARYPELYKEWMETPTKVQFPNGESFHEVRLRVLKAFDQIQCERAEQTVAIVSHGGVNRILIAWALQIPDDCLFRLAQNHAAINLLTIMDGFPTLQLMNHCPAMPIINRMVSFLESIGLAVRLEPISEPTFLPGITVRHGVLTIDESQLLYSGDILHEAGHLAMLTSSQRSQMNSEMGDDGGAEMAAIAWSYAAAIHLGVPPEVIFHPAGYRGGAQSLIDNFRTGHYVGVPMLQWAGLTNAAYPSMLRWVRDE